MTQQEAAKTVIAELNHKGFQAFLVGGCVRDLILGRTPKDFDVTTDALPEAVQSIFPKTIAVGASFGVITVVIEGVSIEVATFRSDGEYSDGRHPDSVSYAITAEDDVSRRDFTINGLLMRQPTREEGYARAMGYPISDPTLHFHEDKETSTFCVVVDHVKGFSDLHNKCIRAIGDPEKRLTEDALRMLRACRFAAQLGFTIAADTMTAMQKLAPTIKKVSEERISAELLKIVSIANPVAGLVPLATSGMLNYLPVKAIKRVFTYTLRRFSMFPTDDAAKGMAMLLCDSTELEPIFLLKKAMRLSTEFSNTVFGALMVRLKLLTSGNSLPFSKPAARKRLMRTPGALLGVALYRQDILLGSDFIAKPFDQARMKEGFRSEAQADDLSIQLLNLTPEEINPPRLVTGDDLIEMGLEPGRDFKFILEVLEDFQLDGEVTTREMMLMNAKDMVKACKNGTL